MMDQHCVVDYLELADEVYIVTFLFQDFAKVLTRIWEIERLAFEGGGVHFVRNEAPNGAFSPVGRSIAADTKRAHSPCVLSAQVGHDTIRTSLEAPLKSFLAVLVLPQTLPESNVMPSSGRPINLAITKPYCCQFEATCHLTRSTS
jgi:hypothetical protein